jgi:hypothetical protein
MIDLGENKYEMIIYSKKVISKNTLYLTNVANQKECIE